MPDKKHKLFERWMWNYTPVSIEGCSCMILLFGCIIMVIFLAALLSNYTGELIAGILAAIVLVPVAIAFYRFADRHS